jgi:Na+/glutamate symporter
MADSVILVGLCWLVSLFFFFICWFLYFYFYLFEKGGSHYAAKAGLELWA